MRLAFRILENIPPLVIEDPGAYVLIRAAYMNTVHVFYFLFRETSETGRCSHLRLPP